MNFKDLSHEEMLNINGGDANSWLRIIGEGIFTAGAVIASGGVIPIAASVASGIYCISQEF